MSPDKAFFGQKDAAQVAVLRRMVRDLNFPLEMVVCPTVRDPDGLAMSSRNRYLSPSQRQIALTLHGALLAVEALAGEGVSEASQLIAAGRRVVDVEPGVRLDYLKMVDPDTLEDLGEIGDGALVAIAAWVGTTRLIDNLVLERG
jgi:pantoate--beta-alanine ligase